MVFKSVLQESASQTSEVAGCARRPASSLQTRFFVKTGDFRSLWAKEALPGAGDPP